MKTRFAFGVMSCLAFAPGAAFAAEPVESGAPPIESERLATDDGELVERSPLRKNIGVSLTAVGIVNMTAGTAVMLTFFVGGGGLGGIYGAILGGPIHFEGSVLMGVGVPLWVDGSQLVPKKSAAPQPSPVPEVSVGPGTGTVTWSF
jgi:hypothetical protein